MKKALIHDWLVTYAGAERCIESFTNVWNDFDIFTLVDYLNNEERSIITKGKVTNTSFIQKLPFSKNIYRNYLPLFPRAIEQFDLREYDFVLSSSSCVAKGVLTRPDQLHISYVHSPIRYAWDLYFQYLEEAKLNKGAKSIIAKYFLYKIRQWDFSTQNRPDYYIANSKYIAKRIQKIYGKEAEVIYPPVDTEHFKPSNSTDNYFVTTSRMVPYKKIDLIVEAFAKLGEKLIVIGDGPDFKKIKSKATKNIEFLGYLSKEIMVDVISKAQAFVFAAEEDFGIAPIEAQACGVPVIAFGKGGALETIKGVFVEEKIDNNKTGIFFKKQDVESIIESVKYFKKHNDKFDKNIISNHAQSFKKERFEKEINESIDKKISNHFSI